MNIIRLLLIGGLIYFAMMQKKEGTRNMILIVTGLLAVCMLSKEGFTVTASVPPLFTECGGTGDGSCTADSSINTVTASDGSTFTFKNGEDYSLDGSDDSLGSGENRITCTTDGTTAGTTGFVDGFDTTYTGSPSASIRDVLVCAAADKTSPTPTTTTPTSSSSSAATLTPENLNKICNINHYETDSFIGGKKAVYVLEDEDDGRCCSCGDNFWFDGVKECSDKAPCPESPPS